MAVNSHTKLLFSFSVSTAFLPHARFMWNSLRENDFLVKMKHYYVFPGKRRKIFHAPKFPRCWYSKERKICIEFHVRKLWKTHTVHVLAEETFSIFFLLFFFLLLLCAWRKKIQLKKVSCWLGVRVNIIRRRQGRLFTFTRQMGKRRNINSYV